MAKGSPRVTPVQSVIQRRMRLAGWDFDALIHGYISVHIENQRDKHTHTQRVRDRESVFSVQAIKRYGWLIAYGCSRCFVRRATAVAAGRRRRRRPSLSPPDVPAFRFITMSLWSSHSHAYMTGRRDGWTILPLSSCWRSGIDMRHCKQWNRVNDGHPMKQMK